MKTTAMQTLMVIWIKVLMQVKKEIRMIPLRITVTLQSESSSLLLLQLVLFLEAVLLCVGVETLLLTIG